jgi:hypothetical protein
VLSVSRAIEQGACWTWFMIECHEEMMYFLLALIVSPDVGLTY